MQKIRCVFVIANIVSWFKLRLLPPFFTWYFSCVKLFCYLSTFYWKHSYAKCQEPQVIADWCVHDSLVYWSMPCPCLIFSPEGFLRLCLPYKCPQVGFQGPTHSHYCTDFVHSGSCILSFKKLFSLRVIVKLLDTRIIGNNFSLAVLSSFADRWKWSPSSSHSNPFSHWGPSRFIPHVAGMHLTWFVHFKSSFREGSLLIRNRGHDICQEN